MREVTSNQKSGEVSTEKRRMIMHPGEMQWQWHGVFIKGKARTDNALNELLQWRGWSEPC